MRKRFETFSVSQKTVAENINNVPLTCNSIVPFRIRTEGGFYNVIKNIFAKVDSDKKPYEKLPIICRIRLSKRLR